MDRPRLFLCPILVFVFLASLLSLQSSAQVVGAVPGQNINMVSGTGFPGGDPYLQRQNEPSMAVSTRNQQHLLAGANDYRTVDIPFPPDQGKETGDAWLGVFTSTDGGQTWSSTLLPGFPQDQSTTGVGSPLHGFNAATDPTVRAGTHGLFYYSGLVFDRGTQAPSGVFVATFQDQNNKGNGAGAIQDPNDAKRKGSPFLYLNATLVDTGTSGQFNDKPWLVVDVPRPGRTATCKVNGKTIQSGYVYLFYTVFLGDGSSPHSQIRETTSKDCGVTWSKYQKLSQSFPLDQGTVAAIDPGTGTVYVVWRLIGSNGGPDAILYAYSTDGGNSFISSTAYTFPAGQSFDESVDSGTFREADLPAATVDGTGRVWVAFSQRNMGPLGSSRIMITTLARGSQSWTKPYVADPTAANIPGHQFMPSLAFAYGKVLLAFMDNREDNTKGTLVCPQGPPCPTASRVEMRVPIPGSDLDGANPNYTKVFSPTISDAGMKIRHTIDVRGALVDPAQFNAATSSLPFPTVRVSQYRFGSRPGSQLIEQLQFNPPNFPMYAKGTKPFIGDYIDVAALTMLPGPNSTWVFNTKLSNAAVFHTTWTDNRDVRPPPVVCNNGVCTQNWQLYTPVGFSSPGTSGYDPTQIRPACVPGQAGSRNQNVYTSRITQGLLVGIKENTKPLTDPTKNNAPIQRAFSVFAANTTNQQTFYRFTVIPANPPGASPCQTDGSTTASFTQFSCTNFVDVIALPRTTVSRTVFVSSSLKFPSVSINVAQITGIGGTPQNGGLQSTTAINPDATNPDITNPDITNPDITNPDITNPDITNPDITNTEVYNPTVTNPDITNPDITNPDITNPDITNPDITNPDITNPDIVNLQVTNPDITNPDITNPDITNPDITNPDITNPDITNPADGGGITDFTFKLSNKGNTSSSYTAKQFAKAIGSLCDTHKCQLIARKTYPTPVASACDLKVELQNQPIASIPNPAFSTTPGVPDNGSDTQGVQPDATVSLGPGEAGRVTMRVFGIVTTSLPDQPVKTVAVAGGANTGTNTPAASLTITTIALPVAVVGTNYNNGAGFMATFVGGVAPVSFSTQSTLPTNITLSSAGLFSGPVTSAPGAFPVALQAADAPTGIVNGQVVPRQQSFDLTNLTLNVNKFTVTAITAQNTGNGGIYLSGNPGDSITVKATVSNVGPANATNVTASVLAFTATSGGGGPTPVLNCTPASPAGVLIPSNSSQDFLYTCTTSGGNGFVNHFNVAANATYFNGPTSVPASSSFTADPSVQITVDTTKPTIATVTATAGNGNIPYVAGTWTNQNVTVTFTCKDNLSGPGAVYPVISGLPAGVVPLITVLDPLTSTARATLTAETPGTTLAGSCIDNASNAVSVPTAFGPIMIDKTPPVLTVAATAGQAPYIASIWTNQNVSVTYSCVDNTSPANANSGITPNSPTGSQIFTQETTTAGVNASGSCVDVAGNVSTNAPLTFGPILIDKTPPTIAFGAIAPAPNGAGWNNTVPVVIPYTTTDNLSGVASSVPASPLNFPTQGANQTITVTVTDIAGNSAKFTSPAVNIDTTLPTAALLTPMSGQRFLLNSTITPNFFCFDNIDNTSCVPSSVGPFTATPVGAAAFTLDSIDTSGNHNHAVTNYRVVYQFNGFQAPLQPASAAPATSTVVVRFTNDSCSGCPGSPFSGADKNAFINSVTVGNTVFLPNSPQVSYTTRPCNGFFSGFLNGAATLFCNGDFIITLPAEAAFGTITVNAFGTPDLNIFPHLQVFLNGNLLSEFDVTATAQDYKAAIPATSNSGAFVPGGQIHFQWTLQDANQAFITAPSSLVSVAAYPNPACTGPANPNNGPIQLFANGAPLGTNSFQVNGNVFDFGWDTTGVALNCYNVLVTTDDGISNATIVKLAPSTTVTGSQITSFFSATGTLANAPTDLTSAVVNAFVPTGQGTYSILPGQGAANGTFSIPNVEIGNYWFHLGTSWLWTNEHVIDAGSSSEGRPNAVFDNATVNFSVSNMTAWKSGDSLEYWTPNVYETDSDITPGQNSQYTAPAPGATSYIDSPTWVQGLVDTTQGDQFFLIHLGATNLGGFTFDALEETFSPSGTITQTPNSTTNFTGNFTQVGQTQTIHLAASASQFAQFAAAAGPAATPGDATFGVYITTPTQEVLFPNPDPALFGLRPTAGITADFDLGDVQYGDPFPANYVRYYAYQQDSSVPFMSPGATQPNFIPAGTLAATLNPPTAAAPISPVVGPVSSITINGSAFTQAMSGVGTTPTITWQAPIVGSATDYAVGIFKLGVNAGGRSTSTLIARLQTSATSMQIPPGILTTGSAYLLEVVARHRSGEDPRANLFKTKFPFGNSRVVTYQLTP